MFPRFTYVVEHVPILSGLPHLFPFAAHFPLWRCLPTHWLTDIWWQPLMAMSNAALNTHMWIFVCTCTCIMHLFLLGRQLGIDSQVFCKTWLRGSFSLVTVSVIWFSLIIIYVLWMWMCIDKLEDNLPQTVLSPTMWIQGIRIGGRYLSPLSYPTDLIFIFKFNYKEMPLYRVLTGS